MAAEGVTVHGLFESQVAQCPAAPAVVHRGEVTSYEELNRRANRLAHHLQRLGVGPEVPVGICLHRSVDLLVGLLGVLKAGGCYVPLEPGLPAARLAFMLSDAAAPVVVTHEDRAGFAEGCDFRLVHLGRDEAEISAAPIVDPVSEVVGHNMAYVIYTSGSTGTPKGVMVEHRGLVNYLDWCVERYASRGGVGAPVFSSIGFDLVVPAVYVPLLCGQQVTLIDEAVPLDQLGAELAQFDTFSFIKLTPTHLDLIYHQIDQRNVARLCRVLVVGGEALYTRSTRAWQVAAPDTVVLNEYGPTEATVANCVYELPSPAAPPRHLPAGTSDIVPIGTPIPHTDVYVLDEELNPSPAGAAGEIYIGGVCVARGYLNRPDVTAGAFLDAPFGAGDRLYRTGDLGRWSADGQLEFLGRIDDQVKIRGHRIEPGEVERMLGSHPGVRDVTVVAREEDDRGCQLVAYVVPVDRDASGMSELRSFAREWLPDYMVPAAFLAMDSLPVTPNGKVDRRALPAPGLERPELSAPFVSPRSPDEGVIAALWAEILQRDEVGVQDDFFELGGDSLLAIQVVDRLLDAFGVELPTVAVFTTPTVAGLVAAIGAAGQG